MPHEIEAKFKVADFRSVRRRLRGAAAVYLGTVMQTDAYYDTPDRRLLGADIGVRIRRTRRLRSAAGTHAKIDTRPLLTYKGPKGKHQRAKIRREIQSRVDSHEAVGEVFEALGLAESVTVQKKRSSYRLGPCLVELDELPILGKFVEIEAPDPEQIEAARRTLGIDAEACTDHYVTLLRRGCSRISKTCLHVTFDNCSRCDAH